MLFLSLAFSLNSSISSLLFLLFLTLSLSSSILFYFSSIFSFILSHCSYPECVPCNYRLYFSKPSLTIVNVKTMVNLHVAFVIKLEPSCIQLVSLMYHYKHQNRSTHYANTFVLVSEIMQLGSSWSDMFSKHPCREEGWIPSHIKALFAKFVV